MNELLLEPITCRDWNQLLAASTNKIVQFRISDVAKFGILEHQIAGSANWNLSLAESAVKDTKVSGR